jgi:uncharacterized protein
MLGETNLDILLKSINPLLKDGEYVFCSINDQDRHRKNWISLEPIAFFHEVEGLTLVLRQEVAEQANLPYGATFRMITLSVHSSLEAVGFLAAITGKLAKSGISVNPVSAYYHDHLFVPTARVSKVMELLREFSM